MYPALIADHPAYVYRGTDKMKSQFVENLKVARELAYG